MATVTDGNKRLGEQVRDITTGYRKLARNDSGVGRSGTDVQRYSAVTGCLYYIDPVIAAIASAETAAKPDETIPASEMAQYCIFKIYRDGVPDLSETYR